MPHSIESRRSRGGFEDRGRSCGTGAGAAVAVMPRSLGCGGRRDRHNAQLPITRSYSRLATLRGLQDRREYEKVSDVATAQRGPGPHVTAAALRSAGPTRWRGRTSRDQIGGVSPGPARTVERFALSRMAVRATRATEIAREIGQERVEVEVEMGEREGGGWVVVGDGSRPRESPDSLSRRQRNGRKPDRLGARAGGRRSSRE
jgi:hypothetical protein